jgi:Ca2+/Na+ antiporter
MNMPSAPIYEERLTSSRTSALFGLLTVLFLALVIWRALFNAAGFMSVVFICLFLMFLFYSLNYRVLHIRLTPEALILRFGLFKWDVPVAGIRSCCIDETSLWRIGGAGIHFSFFKGSYRAILNFLEYPRVVLTLKQKRNPVREIAFSTTQPKRLIHLLTKTIFENKAA